MHRFGYYWPLCNENSLNLNLKGKSTQYESSKCLVPRWNAIYWYLEVYIRVFERVLGTISRVGLILVLARTLLSRTRLGKHQKSCLIIDFLTTWTLSTQLFASVSSKTQASPTSKPTSRAKMIHPTPKVHLLRKLTQRTVHCFPPYTSSFMSLTSFLLVATRYLWQKCTGIFCKDNYKN